MPKHDPSDSEHEETSENSSSESDEAGKPSNGQKDRVGSSVSEYEKQRLSRIAENRARMEALGLPKIASSVMGSGQNGKRKNKKVQKGKAKVFEDDEEYRPEEEESCSYSSQEEAMEEDDDDDYLGEKTSGSRRKKNKGSKSKKALPRSILSNKDCIDDDEALKQAIAMSLQGSVEVSAVAHSGPLQRSNVDNAKVNERKGNNQIPEDTGRKRKKSFASRLQMTEDELVLHFFQFDGKFYYLCLVETRGGIRRCLFTLEVGTLRRDDAQLLIIPFFMFTNGNTLHEAQFALVNIDLTASLKQFHGLRTEAPQKR
ncbi:unnamed protein product [Prunus armeniaca]